MSATIVIECPNCATKYNVIEEAIKPRGRTVACTQCKNKWHVEPTISAIDEWEERFKPDPIIEPISEIDGNDAEIAGQAEEEEEAFERYPAPPEGHEDAPDPSFIAAAPQIVSEPDSDGPKKAAFGLLAASLLVLAGAIFGLRGPIERAWPNSARLYQVAGIEKTTVPGQGLELKDVHANLTTDSATGAQTLTIEAKVLNPLKTSVAVPSLTATLISAGGGPARHWTFDTSAQKLAPEAMASAKASFDGANSENGKILLTFSADNSVESK